MPDPSLDNNPLGLGPRDAEESNTGSVEDTRYDAKDSDPYTTGEPRKSLTDSDDTIADDDAAPRDADGR